MHCSFESFKKIVDSGLISNNVEEKPEIYFTPKKGSEGSPFLNNYKLIILEKDLNRLPEGLGFITPFLTVQKSIAEVPEAKPTEDLDLSLWQHLWDHVSVLYIYSAYLAVRDPWDHALKITDDFDAFEDFDLKSFYNDFDHLSSSSLEYYLLTNFQFPTEYVQKALARKAIATHFHSEIFRLFDEYEKSGNRVDKDLFEKVSKWAPHISGSNTIDFIERAVTNWANSLREIDATRIVLVMLLFALEGFYSRLSQDEILRQSTRFTAILRANKKLIKDHARLSAAQFFLYGRMLHNEILTNKIQFFPDYLKLVRTTTELYDYVTGSKQTERWHDKGTVRQNTDYLHIGVNDINTPGKFSLKVNVDNLNQLSHIPPYLFFKQLRSLILCNAELMHFTEQHFGLNPGVMYQELKDARRNQHYDLKGSLVLEELFFRLEEQVKNRLLSNVKN